MNLNLSALGWIHAAACLAALATGMVVLARPKGTARHRRFGHLYLIAMLVTNLSALGIYRRGVFYFPHWFAIAALTVMAIGLLFARFRRPAGYWVNVHLTSMVASYYILIGGGVNEVFLRVDALRAIAPHIPDSPPVRLTHAVVLIVFVILATYFNVRRLPSVHVAGAVPWPLGGSGGR